MNFEEAEAKFRQLQARVQRGEPVSRAEYEEQVSQLAVQDMNGVLWEINPRTGKWMYFDGAEWISGTPPGHDNSTVMPMPGVTATQPVGAPAAPPVASAPPRSFAPMAAPQPTAASPRQVAPSASAPKPSAAPEAVPPFKRTGQGNPPKQGKPASSAPSGGGQPPARSPLGNMFAGREWVPLAIAAVVLLICAALAFIGAPIVSNLINPAPARTPTRVALPPTPTPVPTIVRLPSPTPIPPTPVLVTAKVTATRLNVRSGPSTKNQLVGTLQKENLVTFLAQFKGERVAGTDSDLWYLINLPSGQQGWVFFGSPPNFQMLGGDPVTLPIGGPGAPTLTPTKAAASPAPAKPTATLTPIGVIPPTPKP